MRLGYAAVNTSLRVTKAKKTRVVSDHRHQTAIENGLQFTLWRTLIESFNMAAHRFADRQGEALAIALYVADQIPLIDDADHAAILQYRQLGDVIQPHAGKDRGQGVVRRGRDGSAFVMAQGDKITEIALFGAGDQSCWRIQSSLNILDRYLLPLSQAKVTTRFGRLCARQ